MTPHHDRVRAVILVHRLEAQRRSNNGESDETDPVVDLTARVARIQDRQDGARIIRAARGQRGDGHPAGACVDADADGWLLALYDAALAELCGALGVRHSLVDPSVSSEGERLRVELELLTVLPVAPS